MSGEGSDVQKGRATEAVRAVDAASDLARRKEALDGLLVLVEHLRVRVNLEAAHGAAWGQKGSVPWPRREDPPR